MRGNAMRKFTTLLTACALLWPSAAYSQTLSDTWTYISTTDKGTDIYALSADLLKGRSHHTNAPVWVKMDNGDDYKTVSGSRTLYSVNCVARTYYSIQTTFYFRDGTQETERKIGTKTAIIPESNMETIAEVLCSDVSSVRNPPTVRTVPNDET
jgi:hypothetical protein